MTAIASICGSYSVRLHVVSVTRVYASVGLTENTGKPTGGVSANLSLPAPLSADGTLPADPFAQHPIHELFRTFRSPTDRQDMLEFLRYRVLADTANQLGCVWVVHCNMAAVLIVSMYVCMLCVRVRADFRGSCLEIVSPSWPNVL